MYNQQRRYGFFGPFILGGVLGSAVSRPNYYPYPPYYYPYPPYYYPRPYRRYY